MKKDWWRLKDKDCLFEVMGGDLSLPGGRKFGWEVL